MNNNTLKIRITKDACHEDCECGDCGYVYEEHWEA